jgi:hypothetical protein
MKMQNDSEENVVFSAIHRDTQRLGSINFQLSTGSDRHGTYDSVHDGLDKICNEIEIESIHCISNIKFIRRSSITTV